MRCLAWIAIAGLVAGPAFAVESDPVANRSYKALFAAAIQRHMPRRHELGEGGARCSFHGTAGGGITSISASGSTPGHAALACRILASVHAPPPPGGGFFASQNFHFH